MVLRALPHPPKVWGFLSTCSPLKTLDPRTVCWPQEGVISHNVPSLHQAAVSFSSDNRAGDTPAFPHLPHKPQGLRTVGDTIAGPQSGRSEGTGPNWRGKGKPRTHRFPQVSTGPHVRVWARAQAHGCFGCPGEMPGSPAACEAGRKVAPRLSFHQSQRFPHAFIFLSTISRDWVTSLPRMQMGGGNKGRGM